MNLDAVRAADIRAGDQLLVGEYTGGPVRLMTVMRVELPTSDGKFSDYYDIETEDGVVHLAKPYDILLVRGPGRR